MRYKIIGFIIFLIIMGLGSLFAGNFIGNKTGQVIDKSMDKALNSNYDIK